MTRHSAAAALPQCGTVIYIDGREEGWKCGREAHGFMVSSFCIDGQYLRTRSRPPLCQAGPDVWIRFISRHADLKALNLTYAEREISLLARLEKCNRAAAARRWMWSSTEQTWRWPDWPLACWCNKPAQNCLIGRDNVAAAVPGPPGHRLYSTGGQAWFAFQTPVHCSFRPVCQTWFYKNLIGIIIRRSYRRLFSWSDIV